MQAIASASTHTGQRTMRLRVPDSLQRLLGARTSVGFRVGEALLWFAFVVMWPALLGGIYFFGGVFESGKAMPIDKFILTSLMVACVKAVVIIPFWWLFFVRLKKISVLRRFFLHLPVGCLYAIASVYIIYQVKTKLMLDPYPEGAVLNDLYNMLTSYFMNFILFHAYNFWLSSQRQQKKEQELRELAFQGEIKALKTQIEPHFLFNTLNSISASVPPSLEKTRVLIAQLADTFRYALRVSEREFVSLGDEIDFLKTWLALEKQRFEERLTVEYKIDENALDVMVPPMILQPLVENALNHGIAHKIGGGVVTIHCELRAGFIYVAVSDTGVGYAGDLDHILNKGVGLSNISRRLKLMYNQSLHVERGESGLLFYFSLPFINI